MKALLLCLALASAAGCYYPVQCRCVCPQPVPAAAAVPNAYLHQVAGATQRLEDRRKVETEVTLEDAQRAAEGLANPEELAREGKAVTDIGDLNRKLEGLVRP